MGPDSKENPRCGNGPGWPSQWTCVLYIARPTGFGNQSKTPFGVGDSYRERRLPVTGPTMDSLSQLGAEIDVRDSTLRVGDTIRLKLKKTPSRYLTLHGATGVENNGIISPRDWPYPRSRIYRALDVPWGTLTDGDLR